MNHFELASGSVFTLPVPLFRIQTGYPASRLPRGLESVPELQSAQASLPAGGKMGFNETDLALFCDVSGFHYLYSCVLLVLIKQQKWHLIQ
jgi:hypothetical protein